ncbi:MAG: HAD family hydrolase [Cyclobacteriaceae bacterium]
MEKFENVIFDLGGVIINLDEQLTVNAFAELSDLTADEIKGKILQFETYKEFEKGKISDADLRNAIRHEFQVKGSDGEFDRCFNAMLLDIPKQKLELLTNLKLTHRIFLLSNTNSIHFKRFNEIMKETVNADRIDGYFHRAYYSHLMGMRKPDVEIFETVLSDHGLDPSRTLFIDDNKINLEGASKLGIHTHHLVQPNHLFDLFV